MDHGTVIVVDDDDAVRRALKFSLELEGLEVRLYGNGDQLLANREFPVRGCLVIDYWMPGIDGVELVSRLRHRHVELPAIMITGKATDDLHRRAARAGFQHVLEKPLEDSALIDSIRHALSAMP